MSVHRFTATTLTVIALFVFAPSVIGAELLTDEQTRMQALRLMFPSARVSDTLTKPADGSYNNLIGSEKLPLIDALRDERQYRVTAPAESDERDEAGDVAEPDKPLSDTRLVRLRLYRLRASAVREHLVLAIMSYSFADVNPPRCCRVIGRIALLSAELTSVLDTIRNMPYAFTIFTVIRFFDANGDGTEDFIVSADFSGAATVGIDTAIFDVKSRKLKPIMWLTTAVSYQLEDAEMFTMTIDEKRTRAAKGKRYYFLKQTYIEKGRSFSRPRLSIESRRVVRSGIVLDWSN